MTTYLPPPAQKDSSGYWIKRFEDGQEVIVAQPNENSVNRADIGSHYIPTGETVTLTRFDPGDNSWLIRSDNHDDCWIFQDCLAAAAEVTDEEVEEALASIKASIKMGLHPDLLRMLAYEEEAIAQGYSEGDVNHYIQPVIGILRLKLMQGELPDKEFLEYAVDRLLKACKAETAWLQKERER